MTAMSRTLKSVLAILLVIAGAVFFYATGLGTGLYVASTGSPVQTTAVAWSTATPTDSSEPTTPSTATAPSHTPGAPTTTEIPSQAPTSTPALSPQPSQSREDAFGVFWEALDILEEEFYGDLPAESELPYAAIQGVIAGAGDQYTAFLDPVQAEIVRASLAGSYEGIGATVRAHPDGKLEIVQPFPDQPAMEAGLRAGDLILHVDGVSLQGMNIYEAVSLIRGPAGTRALLLVEREGTGEPFEVYVERARIEVPTVESRMLGDGIAYVKLSRFGLTATEQVREALSALNAQEPQGLIFDLRGNGGGYLSVAIEISSQFVGQGPILFERFKDQSEQVYEAIPGGLALDIPLVLLVDGGTASASEIVAGAVQDTERGTLIGTTTLGKGSVQKVHTLSDNSQLRVTVAHWFTPGGRAIHGQGLVPDIEVEITEEDIAADRDPQLDRAILYLLEGK